MGIGILRERMADLARRCGDLSPIREPVRRILWEGNRENKTRGLAPDGTRYPLVALSTQKRRPRPGRIPFMTRGAASTIVTGFVVDVQAGPGRLTFTGGWPGLGWPEYHVNPWRTRPARDPYGWRRVDLEDCRELMRDHVVRRRFGIFR